MAEMGQPIRKEDVDGLPLAEAAPRRTLLALFQPVYYWNEI